VLASWPLAPCEGPTGIAYDRATNRIFSGCGKTSVVVDAATGKVVATIANGDGVDALGWDAAQHLIYIPAGRDSNVTVVREDAPDKYTVVATVATMRGAKTITVDPVTHTAPYTDADVRFMAGMIGHHAQAVLMAGWAPSHGASQALRALCERIVVGQRDEIVMMQRWLRDRHETVPDIDTARDAMPG